MTPLASRPASDGRKTLRRRSVVRPLQSPFHIAGRSIDAFETLVVEVSDGRRVGRGEATPVHYRGETIEGLLPAVDATLAEVEAGADRLALRALMAAGAARNAIDCALWDLEAQQAGAPVWRLAGLPEPGPILTTFTLGCDTPAAMARAALGWSQARAMKLKLNGDGRDGTRIAAVRDARPDVWLGVDANQSLSPASFEDLREALATFRVKLVEQPLPVGCESAARDLRSPAPVFADESVQGLADIEAVRGCFDGVNIKLDKCGGLTEGLMMVERARALGLKVMIGTMGGSSLAMAPAFLLAQIADYADLDGPLFLAADEIPSAAYDYGLIVCDPQLWGSGREILAEPSVTP